ncbi:hypothetical protein ASE26_20950 [Duganella sp. Root198D2]|nr:hypothetical protein ASD07_24585 [Duganella sp. Root336D2]KRC01490.1 hypothetical protein ASE26_20950 [Duganella sp. Root198D2]
MYRRFKAPKHRPGFVAHKIVKPKLSLNILARSRNCTLQSELELRKAWWLLFDVQIDGRMEQDSGQLVEM